MTTKVPFSISLVIPTYNNANTLQKQLVICEKVMQGLCSKYEIIISNDASKDKTKTLLNKYFRLKKNYKIYNQSKNLGVSDNIRFLYQKASCEYILLFSIDGAWNPKDIARLTLEADKKKADIVIGKRIRKSYPLKRKIISAVYNAVPYILFGVKTHDTGSIKIFKRKLFQGMQLYSKSIFFEGEFIVRAKKLGSKVFYIPIDHFQTDKKVKSGVNRKLVLASFRDMIEFRFRRIKN